MNIHSVLLGYVGPETLVPAASVIAAIIGGLLAFGRVIFRSLRKAVGFVFRR